MRSATDALFTLHSSLEYHRAEIPDATIANAEISNGAKAHDGGRASGVTGVCFVRDPSHNSYTAGSRAASCNRILRNDIYAGHENDGSSSEDISDEGSSDDDCQPLQFRCSNLLLGPQRNNLQGDSAMKNAYTNAGSYQHATHLSASSHDSLSGAILASCHFDGSCKLWDLATRRCISNNICQDYRRGGSGLALRRVGTCRDETAGQFLYQTRDPSGTVSLHDLDRPCTPLLQIHTHSTSFCAMSPCHIGTEQLGDTAIGGAQNLVALPTEEHSVAVVRDLRCNPRSNPSWRVAVGDEYISTMYGTRRKYGMLTSLALCLQETTQRIVIGCGMENGSALFYDLGAMGRGRNPWWIGPGESTVEQSQHDINYSCISSEEISEVDSRYMCGTTLGKDPVLCLDLSSSYIQSQGTGAEQTPSLVAVGGCAGDVDELSELPDDEQGTVSTIKVKLADDGSKTKSMKAKVRAKTLTCSIDSGGKLGVSICRFRPDGRVLGVGGWDRRLRIYGRTSSKPLAVLRGHEESVTAMDWANNAAQSGLLATGAGDGKVSIFRVFPHSLKS